MRRVDKLHCDPCRAFAFRQLRDKRLTVDVIPATLALVLHASRLFSSRRLPPRSYLVLLESLLNVSPAVRLSCEKVLAALHLGKFNPMPPKSSLLDALSSRPSPMSDDPSTSSLVTVVRRPHLCVSPISSRLSLSLTLTLQGGTADILSTARQVLIDWNHHKIPFFTKLPTPRRTRPIHAAHWTRIAADNRTRHGEDQRGAARGYARGTVHPQWPIWRGRCRGDGCRAGAGAGAGRGYDGGGIRGAWDDVDQR